MIRKSLLIVSFVLFAWHLAISQKCATTIPVSARNIVFEDFQQFHREQKQIALKRKNQLAKGVLKTNEGLDIIRIKRWVVAAPVGEQLVIPTENQWNAAIERANEAFSPAGIKFEFNPDMGAISNSEYYRYEANTTDNSLFTKYIRSEREINLYLVGCILDEKGDCASGMSSIPSLVSGGLDDRLSGQLPGNSILITPWGVSDYDATFTHELGHFFGLLHTFESTLGEGREEPSLSTNSSKKGDLVWDTKPNHESISIYMYPDCKTDKEDKEYIYEQCYFTPYFDCQGIKYDPDYDNYMSYFANKHLNKFTPIQIDRIFYIKNKYRGYLFNDNWLSPVYKILEIGSKVKVSFSANRASGGSLVMWEFPGGSPSIANGEVVEVIYPASGTYNFSASQSLPAPFLPLTVSGQVFIPDLESLAKPLPIFEGFESGIPGENTGWEFHDRREDCYYFNYAFFGSKNSSKSLFIRNFDADPGNNDLFKVPNVKVSGFKNLSLSFDRAFCHKAEGQIPDTLIISMETYGKKVVKKLFGAELVTTAPRALYFRPNEFQWKTTSIDLVELVSDGSELLNVSFLFKAKGGNNLYIDNIQILGTGSIELTAAFKRLSHKIELTWPNFADDETGYTIEKKKDEFSAWTSISRVEKDVTFWSEDATEKLGVYFYRVTAENSTQLLPTKEASVIALIDVHPPKMLQTIVADRNVGVKWTDPNDYESNYDLYYSYQRGAPMEKLFSLQPNTPEYLHRGLPGNTKVYYMVKAKELAFESAPSDTIEALVDVIPVTSRINRVEAYFDNIDPGFGAATALNTVITNEDAISFASPALNVSYLNDGVHTLTVRARDSKGYWSQLHSTPFLKLSTPEVGVKLLDLQYSLNASASGATWNTVFLDPNVNTNEGIYINIEPNQISPLPDGIHFITVRAKDNKGFWSNYFHQSFLKLSGTYGDKKIVNLEYSIDNGLLIGTGTAVTLTPGKYANVSIDLPPLPNGKHFISLRSKDDGGYTSNITIDSFVVRDQSFCEKNSIVFYRSLINNARTYVWQQNDGSGWVTITDGGLYSGARTQVLRLDSPPTIWYGYQYRCIVNGVPTTPFILKFSDTWTGAESDEWHNPNNWCCGGVPDENTDVVIDPATTRKPKISANGICRSLRLKPGSNITVENGNTLDIRGRQ